MQWKGFRCVVARKPGLVCRSFSASICFMFLNLQLTLWTMKGFEAKVILCENTADNPGPCWPAPLPLSPHISSLHVFSCLCSHPIWSRLLFPLVTLVGFHLRRPLLSLCTPAFLRASNPMACPHMWLSRDLLHFHKPGLARSGLPLVKFLHTLFFSTIPASSRPSRHKFSFSSAPLTLFLFFLAAAFFLMLCHSVYRQFLNLHEDKTN